MSFRDKRTGRFVSAETAHRSNAQRKRYGKPTFYVDVARQKAARKAAVTRAKRRAKEERAEARRLRERARLIEEAIEEEDQEVEIALDYPKK